MYLHFNRKSTQDCKQAAFFAINLMITVIYSVIIVLHSNQLFSRVVSFRKLAFQKLQIRFNLEYRFCPEIFINHYDT